MFLQVNKVVWGHIPKLPPRTDPDYEAMKTLRELVRSLWNIFQQAGHQTYGAHALRDEQGRLLSKGPEETLEEVQQALPTRLPGLSR